MDKIESLNHTKWDCKYHVVFIPKCRRKTLYGQLRQQLGEVLRCADKQLWRRIEHYVGEARKLDDMSTVTLIGIDETSLRKGKNGSIQGLASRIPNHDD